MQRDSRHAQLRFELFLLYFYLRSQSNCCRSRDKTAADRSNCAGHETGEVSEHFIDHIKQVFIAYAGEYRRVGRAAHFFDEVNWLADPAAQANANANRDGNGFATLPHDVVRIRILSRVMPEPRLLFLVRPYDVCTRTAPYEPTLKAIRNFSLGCKYFHALALLYRRLWPIQVRRYASQLEFDYEMKARPEPVYDAIRDACRKRYGVDPVVYFDSQIPQQAFVNIGLSEDKLGPPEQGKLDKFLIPGKSLALRLPTLTSVASAEQWLQAISGQLEELEVSDIQSTDSRKLIANALRTCTTLGHFAISYCGLELLKALIELNELVSLKLIKPIFLPSDFDNLKDAKFADKLEYFALTATLAGYFQLLPAILPKFAHLLELQLAPLNFGEQEAQGLAEAVASLPMLRNLAVKNIDRSAIKPLASMLRNMPGLQQFSAQGNVTGADTTSLLDALSSAPLEQLILGLSLDETAAKALSARLSKPECALRHLELQSFLSLPVAQELVRGITSNTSLEALILKLLRQNYHMGSSSSSSDDSDSDDHSGNPEVMVATLIAKIIPEARGLRRLCVSLKGLRPRRVAAIAAALLLSPTVLELDLTGNEWDARTSAIFLECLEKNLVLLHVQVPDVAPGVSSRIEDLLQRNRIRKSGLDVSIS